MNLVHMMAILAYGRFRPNVNKRDILSLETINQVDRLLKSDPSVSTATRDKALERTMGLYEMSTFYIDHGLATPRPAPFVDRSS